MSALGQKQTFAVPNGMSALPPNSGHVRCKSDVRFVPIAAATIRADLRLDCDTG